MRDRFKPRLTYANVTATLALFIALGGSSYAALTLPRNSVGSNQIRRAAVGSSELRDRAVRLRDISVRTRGELRGRQGPAGAPGAQGPPGSAAARFFAVATSSGRFVRGNAVSGGREPAIGTYAVGFAESVSGCAYAAVLGSTDSSVTPPGRITVSDLGGRVGVQTYDGSGTPTDLPFHLFVAC